MRKYDRGDNIIEEIAHERECARYRTETEKVIETLDYKVLQEEFDTILGRCQISEGYNQVVPLENISPGRLKGTSNATYFSGENKIVIDPRNIAKANPGLNSSELKNHIIRILIHEQTHAVSTDPEDDRIGYSEKGFYGHTYVLWNEGVTELLASEITDKYMRRLGLKKEKMDDAYQIPVEFVKKVMQRIADDAGVSQEVVWGAIQKGFFSHAFDYSPGDDLFDSMKEYNEYIEEFNSLFADGFLGKLAYADSDDLSGEEFERFKNIGFFDFLKRQREEAKEKRRAQMTPMQRFSELIAEKLGLSKKK